MACVVVQLEQGKGFGLESGRGKTVERLSVEKRLVERHLAKKYILVEKHLAKDTLPHQRLTEAAIAPSSIVHFLS